MIHAGRRAAWAAVLGVAGAAAGQSTPATDDLLTPPADRWSFRFEPAAWYAAPGGEVTLPGSAAKVELWDLNLDRPRLAPYGELHVRKGDYRATVAGFSVSLDDVATIVQSPMQIGGLAVSAGDLVVASVEVTSAEVVGAMQIGGPQALDGRTDPDYALCFELLAGARMYHTSFDFRAPAGSQSADEFFLTPLAGIKATMNIRNTFDIDLQVVGGAFSTGGDHSVFCLEITNGYTYRPVENVGVQIGYRLSYYSLSDGAGASEFEYSGAVAGIFGGVTLRF